MMYFTFWCTSIYADKLHTFRFHDLLVFNDLPESKANYFSNCHKTANGRMAKRCIMHFSDHSFLIIRNIMKADQMRINFCAFDNTLPSDLIKIGMCTVDMTLKAVKPFNEPQKTIFASFLRFSELVAFRSNFTGFKRCFHGLHVNNLRCGCSFSCDFPVILGITRW